MRFHFLRVGAAEVCFARTLIFLGKMSVEEFRERVEKPDVNSLPYVAPANGLYLLNVEY